MPVVTRPPVLVALTAQPDSNQNTQFIGARHIVVIGQSIYAGLVESPDGNPPFHFQVYKSTNQGSTWHRMDSAHEPTAGAVPIYVATAASDGVYFVWNDSTVLTGQALEYARFDPATDTWGATVTTPDAITTGAYQSIARRSNGDIVVFYQNPDITDLNYGIFSHAGVWGGDTAFYLGVSDSRSPMALVAPDDTVHVIWNDGLGPFPVFYSRLNPVNVVSAAVQIASIADQIEPGLPQIWNNRLVFPYGTIGGNIDSMLVGTPASAPLWAAPLALPLDPSHTFWPIAFITTQNTLLLFQTLIGAGNHPLQLWYTPWNGAGFGTSVLFYDALANPPVTGTVRDLLIFSVTAGAGGGIIGVIAMQRDNGAFPPEDTFFLVSGCPPNAQGV